MKRAVLVAICAVVFSSLLTGCGLVNKVREDFNKGNDLAEQTDLNNPTILVETPDLTTTDAAEEKKTITLYFADPVDNKLVAEEREIAKVVGIARATIEELIKGPAGSGLQATLPASTKLLDINIREDGVAIVDFSGDLIRDLPVTAQAEELAVFSIVNTLAQFPTVQEVEIRVDGRNVDTLLGYVDFEEGLVKNTSIMK
jgi:germination protein M